MFKNAYPCFIFIYKLADRRYVFTRFNAEKDLSLVIFVAGMMSINLEIFTTSDSKTLW